MLQKNESAAEIRDRSGNPVADSCAKQGKLLKLLYGTAPGRASLKLLTQPMVSYLAGQALEHPLSTVLIPPFVRTKHIRLEDYPKETYRSFNAFFTRSVKPAARPVDGDPAALISPCDAKLTVVPITENVRFTVKNAEYSLPAFLGCKKLADRFDGGFCLIFRLTPDDYHRYCYPDAGTVGKTRCIQGVLHTVNPVSAEYVKVYHQNTRTITLLHSEHFGHIALIEVGAMLVGRIINHPHAKAVVRGREKGYFAFGGSTIVLLLERGRAILDPQIMCNSEEGAETIVRYGSRIGTSMDSIW